MMSEPKKVQNRPKIIFLLYTLFKIKYSISNVKKGAKVPKKVALAILVIFIASKNNTK